MSIMFARALRAATRATQAGDLAQAARIMQLSLSRAGHAHSSATDVAALAALAPETLIRQGLPWPPVISAGATSSGNVKTGENQSFKSPAALPDGASFETRSFTCASGTRSYKLYVSASAARQPNGLIVMLHGCTQNPDDFAAGTRMNLLAEKHGLLVAWPFQPRTANPSGCWNWFNPGDQRRDGGEPAVLAGIAREIAAEFGLRRNRVFAAGLSAGGAMAAVLGKTYPDVFSAIGVHSGLACGAARDVPSAFAAMKGKGDVSPPRGPHAAARPELNVRTIIFHGTADKTVHAVNAEKLAASAADSTTGAQQSPQVVRECNGRMTRISSLSAAGGLTCVEVWQVEGAGHAWFGGSPGGSYTDALGPDASAEMVRFFLA